MSQFVRGIPRPDLRLRDLDGDALEVGEPTAYQRDAYDAFLAVVLSRSAILLTRPQVENLRDYLNNELEARDA